MNTQQFYISLKTLMVFFVILYENDPSIIENELLNVRSSSR